jgi:hypothetical protein
MAPVGRRRRPTGSESIALASWASWFLVVLGIVLRIRQYVFDRSLWNDEASLAINIINRGYGGLTHKLAVEQGAPIGFLWLEKTATELFGNSEDALRLVPLLAGIASVLLFRRLANRLLTPVPALVALGLFAVSPSLVYYASEAKQYGFDAFAALALASFLPWLLAGELSWKKSVWWGVTAAVLVWCSFPAVFVAGSVSAVVALHVLFRHRWGDLGRIAAGSAVWGASFATDYFVALRSLHSDPHLLGYWASAFPPRPLAFTSTQVWLRQDLHLIVGFPWDLKVYPLTIVLLAAGLVALLWRQRTVGIFMLVLGLAVVAAAVDHAYPMADRMVLFTVPFVCLLLGAVLRLIPKVLAQALMVGLVLVVGASSIGMAASAIVHPYTKTEVREAYQYVLRHEKAGDAVLVEWEGLPDFIYYHETLGVRGDGTFKLTGSTSACDNAAQLAQLDRWKRVWLVLGIDPHSERGHPIEHYISAFRSIAKITSVYNTPGPSAAVLLTIEHGTHTSSSTIAAPPWQPDPFGCLSVQIAPLAGLQAGISQT